MLNCCKQSEALKQSEPLLSESRKLAAILAADVVGYSRLAGADEDRTSGAAAGAAQRSDRSHHRRA